MLRNLIQNYPELAALTVLVLGIVLGKLAELGVLRLFSLADRLTRRYGSGGRLIIEEDEGIVVDIYRAGLTLSTEQGLVFIPASRLANNHWKAQRIDRDVGRYPRL